MNKSIPFTLLCCLLAVAAEAEDGKGLQLVESRRIWDKALHNAFTDLIRFKDRWYCVFREGKGHLKPDNGLRQTIDHCFRNVPIEFASRKERAWVVKAKTVRD